MYVSVLHHGLACTLPGSMIPSGGPQLASSTESVMLQGSMRGGALKKSKASSITSSRKGKNNLNPLFNFLISQVIKVMLSH